MCCCEAHLELPQNIKSLKIVSIISEIWHLAGTYGTNRVKIAGGAMFLGDGNIKSVI